MPLGRSLRVSQGPVKWGEKTLSQGTAPSSRWPRYPEFGCGDSTACLPWLLTGVWGSVPAATSFQGLQTPAVLSSNVDQRSAAHQESSRLLVLDWDYECTQPHKLPGSQPAQHSYSHCWTTYPLSYKPFQCIPHQNMYSFHRFCTTENPDWHSTPKPVFPHSPLPLNLGRTC